MNKLKIKIIISVVIIAPGWHETSFHIGISCHESLDVLKLSVKLILLV